ncbi:MAG: hypothetical protein ACM3ZF_11690 [Mycobacterium leprae]
MEELSGVVQGVDDDALALVDAQPPITDEAGYARAARAANTVKGYRSDWREGTAWCAERGLAALPGSRTGCATYRTRPRPRGWLPCGRGPARTGGAPPRC